MLKIRGNIYYGSLPVIESTYHNAMARVDNLVIDFSECYYIDPEGVRWLAAAKGARKARLVDRRSGSDRRAGTRGGNGPPRRRRPDRRRRSEF